MSQKNVVVVPIYKTALTKFEEISLRQCFQVFVDRDILAVAPQHLDLSDFSRQYPFNKVIRFENRLFNSIHGYNELMLSSAFYEAFLDYDFMLIYQTDAFVFKDELDKWTNAGFDYIGAPWLKPLKNKTLLNQWLFQIKSYLYTKFNVKRDGLPKSKQFYNKVGNGGFSLRNIPLFYRLAKSESSLAKHYIDLKNLAFNEDLFWSIEINRNQKRLRIPNYKIAVGFSMETFLEEAYQLNNRQLPFGCHAWEKHLDFWRDRITNCGYDLG